MHYRQKQKSKLVSQIKDVRSPVFCSKLCHFVAPTKFPVIDNAAMGLPYRDYGTYWMFVRREWCETSNEERQRFEAELKAEIDDELTPNYPLACKIVEILHVHNGKAIADVVQVSSDEDFQAGHFEMIQQRNRERCSTSHGDSSR